MAEKPCVTVLIVAFERPEELRSTLSQLRNQEWTDIELVLIDDHSSPSLERLVQEEWPNARYIRNETNLGYIRSRSLGMLVASGVYVLSLDDDSCLTDTSDIARGVQRMERDKSVGVLAFDVYNGRAWPGPDGSAGEERDTHTFTGCAHMMRREVISGIGIYRDFYQYYAEENEYALRAMDAGWKIVYCPSIIVHHRVSEIGRNRANIWAYSLRNNIWTVLQHFPLRKLPLELAWKVGVGAVEAIRLFQIPRFVWALGSGVRRLPLVLRYRKPVSRKTIAHYERLRFGFDASGIRAEGISFREKLKWFKGNWLRRRRARPFWDRKAGGIGVSSNARFLDPSQGGD